ncbi:hypothetical protein DL96DRAFT_1612994 [Flagelloscypha sp. PMI_526]|nr:hypothetical protein DL96DRAFT_1612994 [Flagelloscypha sp. PMI_526]
MSQDYVPEDGEITNTGASGVPQKARAYQQEMLEESRRRNIIVALDTGSGKTFIAILRMMLESQNEPHKLSWFLSPTVTLVQQQFAVIQSSVSVKVGVISGAQEPDQWTDEKLWQRVLSSHRIIVSTPQVLLDALRNGHMQLGRDISLLVFDEAHHAVAKHPYNLIMQEHYTMLTPRSSTSAPTVPSVVSPGVQVDMIRPMVMGLTASPIFGTNVQKAFKTIEANLDSTIRSIRINKEELARYTHKPRFKHTSFFPDEDAPPGPNLAALSSVVNGLVIEDDPWVKGRRERLKTAQKHTVEWRKLDQQLSDAIHNKNTFCHKGLHDLKRMGFILLDDLGSWAADWYISEVVKKVCGNGLDTSGFLFASLKSKERQYLRDILSRVEIVPTDYSIAAIEGGITDKVIAFIQQLEAEDRTARDENEPFSGIVFVTARIAVLALQHILQHHPKTKPRFRTGALVGVSDNSQRRNKDLDLTRSAFAARPHHDVLMDFRLGQLNLLICTAVAEEGIDIQSCSLVIRWDPPTNTASWAQSQGRARRKKSTFILMFKDGSDMKTLAEWQKVEQEMKDAYEDPARDIQRSPDIEDEEDPDSCIITVPETGAVVNLDSVVSRLSHFCNVIPGTDTRPIFSLDPPEYQDEWHAIPSAYRVVVPYQGPWGSSVTLPRQIPLPPREFVTEDPRTFGVERKYATKRSAYRHAAFEVYDWLHKAGLLNEHLLPLSASFEVENDEVVKALLKRIQKKEGMTDVDSQLNPWTTGGFWRETAPHSPWLVSILLIHGLPPLQLLTRSRIPEWNSQSGPTLYLRNSPPCRVSISTTSHVISYDDPRVQAAKEYTRHLFWPMCMSRMDWNQTDFCYLFLPVETTPNDQWKTWSDWARERHAGLVPSRHPGEASLAHARSFGEQFSYPDGLTMIRSGFIFARAYDFVRWEHDTIPPEDLEELKQRAKHRDGDGPYQPHFPLLVVKPMHPKVNFLTPPPISKNKGKERDETSRLMKEKYLDPDTCSIVLVSPTDLAFGTLLPSVLRALSMSITTSSFTSTIWPDFPQLAKIQPSLLQTALLAPIAQESTNYQRLETLGDTVLKLLTSFQLLAQYPLWHEGYLTKKRDHSVANVSLAKRNVDLGLFRWIIRDRMLGKKFKPLTYTGLDKTIAEALAKAQKEEDAEISETSGGGKSNKKKRKKGRQLRDELSTKVLADVIESILGAAYLHGGLDLAFECCRFLNLGMEWEHPAARLDCILERTPSLPHIIPADIAKQLEHVETMIGYTFRRKALLLEALTHSSCQNEFNLPSYERLEFAGDAVLDMVVNEYVFRAEGKNYSPGHMFLRKSAMVNAHLLGYICLRAFAEDEGEMPFLVSVEGRKFNFEVQKDPKKVYLYQCLFHESQSILLDIQHTAARYRIFHENLEQALQTGRGFPWGDLTRLQAPKFLSDMIESILGAAYIDSRGNMDIINDVLQSLGWLPILERIVAEDVDVRHPVSRMVQWAQQNQKEVTYDMVRDGGQLVCIVRIDKEEKLHVESNERARGKCSEAELRMRAAEMAIKEVSLRG